MDPSFLSATQLADLVRSRKIGALELLDHYIGRTESLDGRINAIVVRDFDFDSFHRCLIVVADVTAYAALRVCARHSWTITIADVRWLLPCSPQHRRQRRASNPAMPR